MLYQCDVSLSLQNFLSYLGGSRLQRLNRSRHQGLPGYALLLKVDLMLPDFLDSKHRLLQILQYSMRFEFAKSSPFLGMLNKSIIHEGRDPILVNEELGSEEIVVLKESSAIYEIDLRTVSSRSLKDIYNDFKSMAENIASDQSQHAIKELDRTLAKVGNVMDMAGKPFTPDSFIAMMEKIWIDFDCDGMPRLPQIVVGPDAENAVLAMFQKLDEEPYKTRMNELMAKKHEEYLERESHRTLVD